ncbi:MAG: Omp28-related outer membrane protein [bacterium]
MRLSIITFLFVLIIANINNAQEINKRVLLEEFSTAPCGFCPEGGIIAEQLIGKYPDLYTFTHHAGFGTDSMTINESKTIASKYTTFAPAAVIDRGDYPCPPYTKEGYIGVSRQKWDSICAIRLNEQAEAEVFIEEVIYNESERMLNVIVKTKFANNIGENDYRLNLAIVEDSVSGIGKGWDQKNYFNNDPKYPDLYHKGDSIVGYIHRHVLRALPTGAWGDASVIPAIPENDINYTYTLENYMIPQNWKPKDIKLFAFLSAYNTDVFQHKIFNTDEKRLIETPSDKPEVLIKNETQFIIKPNPVTNLAYIECQLSKSSNCKFELFDSGGRKLRDIYEGAIINSSNIYFYASDLASGLYFIKITSNNNVIIRNFIIL